MRFIFFFLLFTTTAASQVNYQNLSFEQALEKSKKESKIIFIQLDSKECKQCNEVADKGLSDKKLSTLIEQTFIPLKLDAKHKDYSAVVKKYDMQKGFGILFIDHTGMLIHKTPWSKSIPNDYFPEIRIALNKAEETFNLYQLEKHYANSKTIGIIELLLSKRKALRLSTDELLDEYVSLLPADSFQSVHTLVFLAKHSPAIGSKADMMMRNNSVFQRAWYTLPNNQRIALNNGIIYKSMEKAINEKNEAKALRVAHFAKVVHEPNSLSGIKAYEKQLLHFYEETNNLEKYFSRAISYYDRYYMTLKPDSIKAIDEKRLDEGRKNAKADTIINGNVATIRKAVSFAPYVQYFANDLIEGVLNFYERTENPNYLKKATEWAERSLVFFESPEGFDVYSKLLYKLNEKNKALEYQQKNIELRKKRGYPTTDYELVLSKMKEGLPID